MMIYRFYKMYRNFGCDRITALRRAYKQSKYHKEVV
jgi:hypothetical protein